MDQLGVFSYFCGVETDMFNKAEMSHYPWWLITRLALHVEHRQALQAREDLERILHRFDREHDAHLEPRKMRCAAVMSQCLRGAHRGGARSDAILEEFMLGLEELARKRSWAGICTFMRKYVDGLLAKVETPRAREIDRLVSSIRQRLASSPAEIRSLKSYAKDAQVNPDYLSRRFTEIVGLRFRDERKKAQVELARSLLESTSLKIRVIAHKVGLKDISRFTRYFRQFVGITPAEYRRLHKDAIGHSTTT